MIPSSFVDQVLSRVDIVDLIERYVPLKKGGANYMACCPFHNEKSPSFSVSPTKQFYHCFGCGAHGTAVGFLMEYAGLPFREAIKELANQVGLQVPEETAHDPAAKAHSQSLIQIMASAAQQYKTQLKQSPEAIEYLKKRGLTGEIAARFGIGFAPEGHQFLRKAFPNDYESAALQEAGLVIKNDSGRHYDRFRARVMFPIQDQRGNVIAFGGRIIGPGEPKYLNSPETPLFEKGRELYGLPQARQAIREGGTVVVVEGYMDVVALAQYGFGAAVATLGTATTATHIQKLMRQADQVVFCFDGDKAGRKAAHRALEASLEQLDDGKAVKFLFLPPEHDPDSYIRQEGLESFRRALDDAMPLTEFLLHELRTDIDLGSAEGRAKLIHNAKDYVPRIAAPILRLQTVRMLAEASGLGSQEVEHALGLKPGSTQGRKKPPPARMPRTNKPSILHQLLEILLIQPALCGKIPSGFAESLDESTPESQAEKSALMAILDAFHEDTLEKGALASIYEKFRETAVEPIFANLLSTLDEDLYTEETAAAVLSDLVAELSISTQTHAINSELKLLAETEKSRRLNAEEIQRYGALLKQKQRLNSGQKA